MVSWIPCLPTTNNRLTNTNPPQPRDIDHIYRNPGTILAESGFSSSLGWIPTPPNLAPGRPVPENGFRLGGEGLNPIRALLNK